MAEKLTINTKKQNNQSTARCKATSGYSVNVDSKAKNAVKMQSFYTNYMSYLDKIKNKSNSSWYELTKSKLLLERIKKKPFRFQED